VAIDPGKDAFPHVTRSWARGKALPVAAVIGIHPLWLAMGGQKFPSRVSEYDAIGGVMGAPLELIEAGDTGLPVPATSEIVLEGFVEPGATLADGPFGEFSGYYGPPNEHARVMTVTAIRHRQDPILTNALLAEYPSIESALFGAVSRSARLWDDLDRLGIPGIRGVWAIPAAVNGKGMVVVSVEQRYPGHAAQVLALAAQAPATAYYTKWVIVVDDDVDPTNMNDVLAAMSTRCNPATDLDILRQTWGSLQDPTEHDMGARLYSSKVLINACKEHRYLATFPRRMALDRRTWERVAERWSSELGLPGAAPRPWTFAELDPADRQAG
jgi:4-hydroxy-3-polyprenylbenzoate decarboxylase